MSSTLMAAHLSAEIATTMKIERLKVMAFTGCKKWGKATLYQMGMMSLTVKYDSKM